MVEVTVTSSATETDDRVWLLVFTGRDAFAGQDRRLTFTEPGTSTIEQVRARLSRMLKFGLVEYAIRSEAGAHMDVTVQPPADPAQSGVAADRARDPWNHWVFRLSANGNRYGEVSSSSSHYSTNASANRTTEAWKIRLAGYRSTSSSRFDLSETETVLTDQSDWSVDTLVVRSLGAHWSAGVTSAVTSSTYSNQKLTATVKPAIEYDFFPYSESSRRSLTLQYAVGLSRYEYRELTIFDRLEETKPRQSLTASLGLRQPWGSAGATAGLSQILNEPSQHRVSVSGSVSVRIFKGLSVNGSTSFSRIRDQFYLEKTGATEEEILLRLRQLATGYSYYANVGFSFSFGSLSNATVNPRFGG
jgi:hypothetical protein